MIEFLRQIRKKLQQTRTIRPAKLLISARSDQSHLSYARQQTIRMYKHLIPSHHRILHINCADGFLLRALSPASAIGVDRQIALSCEANIDFYQYLAAAPVEPVDFVIISSFNKQQTNMQQTLQEIHRFCTPKTRIFIECSSYYWQPLHWFIALCKKEEITFDSWLSNTDLLHLFHLNNLDFIKQGRYFLVPFFIPYVSSFFNRFLAPVPLLNWLCCNRWFLVKIPSKPLSFVPTVSVIIPCRNERGTIKTIIERLPFFGTTQEIIFVEGGSTDGTREEIERSIAAYPERLMQLLIQDGAGKGDAVRKGFVHAKGEVLVILDADLAVAPEELLRFFDALVAGKGECINGSRLVYGMESGAIDAGSFVANIIIATFMSWLIGQPIKDTLCGTKMVWKKDYEKMAAGAAFFGKDDPFSDFDLLLGADNLHLKIIDMPVKAHRRRYGTTNIFRFRDGLILAMLGLRALKRIKLH